MDAQTTPPAAVTPPPPPAAVRMSWPRRILAVLFVLAIAGVVAASLKPKAEPPVTVQAGAGAQGGHHPRGHRRRQAAGRHRGEALLQHHRRPRRAAHPRGRPGHQGPGARPASTPAATAPSSTRPRRPATAPPPTPRCRTSASPSSRPSWPGSTGWWPARTPAPPRLEKARAELDGARAQAASAEQRLAQADAALREARHQFSLTTITAPIDGIVTQRLKQVGERVRGSDFSEDVLMVIATLSKMEMKMEVGEHEVVYVKEGDPAEIEIDAFPDRKFKAQVVEVARNATVKNAGTEQEVTTFVVRLALVDQVAGALPGMSAQAAVSTDTRAGRGGGPHPGGHGPRREGPAAQAGGSPSRPPPQPPPPPPGKKARKEPLQKVVFVVAGRRGQGCARSRPAWPPTPRSRSSPA